MKKFSIESMPDSPKKTSLPSYFKKLKNLVGLGAAIATIGSTEGEFGNANAETGTNIDNKVLVEKAPSLSDFLHATQEAQNHQKEIKNTQEAETFCKQLDALVVQAKQLSFNLENLTGKYKDFIASMNSINDSYSDLHNRFGINIDTPTRVRDLRQILEFITDMSSQEDFGKEAASLSKRMSAAGIGRNITVAERNIDMNNLPSAIKTNLVEVRQMKAILGKIKDKELEIHVAKIAKIEPPEKIKSDATTLESEVKTFIHNLDLFTERIGKLVPESSTPELQTYNFEQIEILKLKVIETIKDMYEYLHDKFSLDITAKLQHINFMEDMLDGTRDRIGEEGILSTLEKIKQTQKESESVIKAADELREKTMKELKHSTEK